MAFRTDHIHSTSIPQGSQGFDPKGRILLQTRIHTTFRPSPLLRLNLFSSTLYPHICTLILFSRFNYFPLLRLFSLILFPLFPLSPYSDSYDYLVLRFSHDPLVQYLRSITRTVVLQFDNCYYSAISLPLPCHCYLLCSLPLALSPSTLRLPPTSDFPALDLTSLCLN